MLRRQLVVLTKMAAQVAGIGEAAVAGDLLDILRAVLQQAKGTLGAALHHPRMGCLTKAVTEHAIKVIGREVGHAG